MGSSLRVFFQRLLRRDRFEGELADELQFHLDARIADLQRRGLNRAEAGRRARIEFGGVEQYKERLRAERPGAALDALVQDVSLSVRWLRREPTFALAVALTLSLGIGATTAVFGIMRATFLSRIPYSAPDRLVVGRTTQDGVGAESVSGLDYFDYRESNRSFDSLAAFYQVAFSGPPTLLTVTGGGDPWVAEAGYVSWNLFRTLRVDPVIGRHFLPEEEAQADARVAIISFGLWQYRLGGAPDVVGRTMVLNGAPHTIVGVMPRGFRFHRDVDIWRAAVRPGEARHMHNYHLVGRLKPGVSMAQAQEDVDAISRALERAYPDSNKGKGLRLVSLQEYLGGSVRTGLLLPAAVTACLLIIACANVAGLLLARGQRRMSEVAMRSALGASRWRLVRQLLTESVVLTLPAAVMGICVACVLQEMLLHLLPVSTLGVTQTVVDGAVLLFALVASVATGLLVGILPAIRGTAVNLSQHLGTGRQLCEPVRSARLRSGLVVVQISISVVLLIGSGLVARSLLRLSEVDFGFSAEQVLTARLEIPAPAYREGRSRQAFFASVVQEIGALPGVLSAATTTHVPILDPGNTWETRTPDRLLAAGELAEHTHLRRVSPGYLAAMNIPLLKGREISEADREGMPAVAVLSESLARRLYADRESVGRTVLLINSLSSPPTEISYEVVGVVGNVRLSDPREEGDPAMYLSIMQENPSRLRIVVRTAGNADGLAEPIREIVRRHDRNALVADLLRMDEIVDESLSDLRRVARYLGLFAGLALLLAAVGLYGAVAYHVSQQEHEIGVRLAMGATRAGVLGLVLRRGTWLVAIGLLLGAAAAYPCTHLVRSLLFETVPLDPATYVAAVLLLGLVAAAACLMPAWRATRVDPAIVLKSE